ncbi:MAG TPA: methyltransferase domain-containing protein [Candidatus Eisenbacteria bacterium]|nr:methyltransferase domain-containing protein [Candidatus Eisenbacteria bacterium]
MPDEGGPPRDDTREEVKRRFGTYAENYVRSPDHVESESRDRLLVLTSPQPEWRVLDIATGGGHTALGFAPHVREVVATDITKPMLEAAERHIRASGITNVRFQEADAMALPFEDASFDLVTCRVAPHHFPDCARFVRESARVARPGGIVAVIDNVVPDDPGAAKFINALEKLRDPSHNWAYTEREWVAFFREAGLRVDRVEGFRKARDFDGWTATMGVEGELKERLRKMLLGAAGVARQSLAPEEARGRLHFVLQEVLLIGVR